MAKPGPGGAAQRERRRGFWPDAEGAADMPAGRCFGDLFLRIGKGLRTTRRMPGASCPSSNIWRWYGRSGVTPKRAPIPALRGRAFERPARFGRGDGLVGEKTLFACGTGPAGDGVACPEEYSGLAAAGVTPWSCTPGIPTGIWQASATGKSSPHARTAGVLVLCVQPVDHGVDDWLRDNSHG